MAGHPQLIHLIIERDLSASFYPLFSEYPNPGSSIHSPLQELSIRVTRVVNKTSVVAFQLGIQIIVTFYVGDVERLAIGFLAQSSLHLRLGDDLSDILDYEVASLDFLGSFQAPGIPRKF
jgi:hypothetical protein